MNKLADQAYQLASKAYEDAIVSRETMDELLDSVHRPELSKRAEQIRDIFNEAINATWCAKQEADKLREDL